MKILGPPTADFATVERNLKTLNPHPRFITDMLPALWHAAVHTGINPIGMIAQAYKETGGGAFSGQVKPEFFNTCGLKNRQSLFPGIDDGDLPLAHARSANWAVGSHAHAQHLAAYAGKAVTDLIVDPRYVWVNQSTPVTDFVQLSGKWAPSATYGAEVEALATKLAAPEKTKTIFSFLISSLGADAEIPDATKIATHKRLFGVDHVQNLRVFFGSNQPTWSDTRMRTLTEKDSVLISFTRYDETAFRAFLAATPAHLQKRPGQLKICYKHEFEAEWRDSADKTGWVRDYLVKNARIAKALDESPVKTQSRDDVVRIFLWYSQHVDFRIKGLWEQFIAGQNFGMIGMDCYHYQPWLKNGRYATEEELFGTLITMGKQTGLPTCVPEWGGGVAAGGTGGLRLAQRITAGGKFLRDNNVRFANWWCATGSKDPQGVPRDHHLDPYPAAVAAMKALIAT